MPCSRIPCNLNRQRIQNQFVIKRRPNVTQYLRHRRGGPRGQLKRGSPQARLPGDWHWDGIWVRRVKDPNLEKVVVSTTHHWGVKGHIPFHPRPHEQHLQTCMAGASSRRAPRTTETRKPTGSPSGGLALGWDLVTGESRVTYHFIHAPTSSTSKQHRLRMRVFNLIFEHGMHGRRIVEEGPEDN
jgi:hypothetical protein